MPVGKTPRRMSLLQLLVHTEKYTHDVREQFRVNFWPSLSEFHDMSRPARKRSSFPTLVALKNGLDRLVAASKDLEEMVANLSTWTEEILDHARREQAHR